MKKKKAIGIYLFLTIMIILGLTACHEPDPKRKPNKLLVEDNQLVGEELGRKEDQEKRLLEEYDKLLEKERNKDQIKRFLDDNIAEINNEDSSQMIIKLEDYLERNNYSFQESYVLLNQYKPYVSLEIKSYLNILLIEASKPFKDEERINISLDRLVERIGVAEDHLIIFPQGETREKILAIYKEYVQGLIVGGENQDLLREEDSSLLKEEVMELYRAQLGERERKGISNILKEYLEILERSKNDLDSEEVKNFHKGLEARIISEIEE